jgi:hypothetical protein
MFPALRSLKVIKFSYAGINEYQGKWILTSGWSKRLDELLPLELDPDWDWNEYLLWGYEICWSRDMLIKKYEYIIITNEILIGDNEASNTIIADGVACFFWKVSASNDQ